MNRLTLPALLMATLLVASVSAVGAAAAPLASGGAMAPAMQEGNGNTTDTPTPTVNDSANSTSGTETNDTNTTTEEPTFGAVVSSFMQTSAADAENEVEDGLFAAQFERSNASERARLVRQRASNIGARIAELREERARLLDGGNASIRERAQAARLAEQSDSLSSSIDQTESAAARANVQLNGESLEQLRTEARDLTGPEVAELARGLVDKDDSRRGGPPEDRGPDSDRTDDVGTETATNGTVTDDGPGNPEAGSGRNSNADNGRDARNPTPRSGDGSDGAPPEHPSSDSQPSDDEETPTETTSDDGSDSAPGGPDSAKDNRRDDSDAAPQ